jgi:hypothetical protein
MRARLMASRREMRPGPDDRCMPDFRKSHSRAPGAWPASPSIRSRVRARTHRSTLASGAVPRVIVPRAPPTDPSLCQPGHSRAHGMSAAPPARAYKVAFAGPRKLPPSPHHHHPLCLLRALVAAEVVEGARRNDGQGTVDRLDAVTEESEHPAGRNGTAAVGGRVLTTLPVTTPLSLSLVPRRALHRPHLPIGARSPRNDDRRARPPHARGCWPPRHLHLYLPVADIIVCCCPSPQEFSSP